MAYDLNTCAHYQNLIDQLNPKGAPTAQLIHRGRDPGIFKVGILDASFNPMTLAHEALINTAKEDCNLDEMLLLLSRTNVDKNPIETDLGQRLALLVLYAGQHEDLSVGICSHARFVDKIIGLTPCYPPGTQFYFIVGYDTLVRLFDPKYYVDMPADLHSLFQTCHFIAANRGKNVPQILENFLLGKEIRPFTDRIHPIFLHGDLANISSTTVRDYIKAKVSIKHLVPEAILTGLRSQGL
jgi:nicotinic acid mononucleotide adenylyltransferase